MRKVKGTNNPPFVKQSAIYGRRRMGSILWIFAIILAQ